MSDFMPYVLNQLLISRRLVILVGKRIETTKLIIALVPKKKE